MQRGVDGELRRPQFLHTARASLRMLARDFWQAEQKKSEDELRCPQGQTTNCTGTPLRGRLLYTVSREVAALARRRIVSRIAAASGLSSCFEADRRSAGAERTRNGTGTEERADDGLCGCCGE